MKVLFYLVLALFATTAVESVARRRLVTHSALPPISAAPVEKQIFGSATVSTTFPWPASITINKPLPPFLTTLCSGALLSPFYLLTSALCALPQANLTVFLGPVDPTSPSVLPNTMSFGVPAGNSIPFPGFNASNLLNNIGLIKLPFPAPVPPFNLKPNPFIGTFGLPSPIDLLSNLAGPTSYLNGWTQNVLNSGINNLLNWTSPQSILPNVDCKLYYATSTFDIAKENICFVNNVTGTLANSLQMNSGSPLITLSKITGAYVLRAIGSLASDGTGPLIFTKIDSFLPWIISQITLP
ncbi:granzyme-like protein 1 [Cloeon dipterum]|uniref:granzyme-like protein 1 n=1 Tax=Cloeon dipterum TaxID=197152 RepID=UPI00321FFD03